MPSADAWQMSGGSSVKCDLVDLRHSKSSNQNQSLHTRCICKMIYCCSLLMDRGHESFICEEHFGFKHLFQRFTHYWAKKLTESDAYDVFAKRRVPSRWTRSC